MITVITIFLFAWFPLDLYSRFTLYLYFILFWFILILTYTKSGCICALPDHRTRRPHSFTLNSLWFSASLQLILLSCFCCVLPWFQGPIKAVHNVNLVTNNKKVSHRRSLSCQLPPQNKQKKTLKTASRMALKNTYSLNFSNLVDSSQLLFHLTSLKKKNPYFFEVYYSFSLRCFQTLASQRVAWLQFQFLIFFLM